MNTIPPLASVPSMTIPPPARLAALFLLAASSACATTQTVGGPHAFVVDVAVDRQGRVTGVERCSLVALVGEAAGSDWGDRVTGLGVRDCVWTGPTEEQGPAGAPR